MKRSEIVRVLIAGIPYLFFGLTLFTVMHCAAQEGARKHETQPPVYEKKTEIRMMPHNQVWTSSKPVNE
jgi:hypothetical protein